MKFLLLGGSNSTIKHGLKSGLSLDVNENLSLGATSSIQNLYALCSNKQMVMECDVIISESNVNDIHNVFYTNYNKLTIKNNISRLFEALYLSGKRVVIILMPLYKLKPNFPDVEIINEINNWQKALCKNYGFEFIDLTSVFDGYEPKGLDIKFLMTDYIHPSNSYMYALGVNIRQYVVSNEKSTENKAEQQLDFFSKYKSVNISCDYKKENSLFYRDLKKVPKSPIYIDVPDYYKLIGIETWSNGDSQLTIEPESNVGSNSEVVKSFNKNLAFNEIEGELLGKFKIRSNEFCDFTTEPTTEVCLTVNEKLTYGVLIGGFLFEDTSVSQPSNDVISDELGEYRDISFLLPDVNPWVESGRRLIKKHGFIKLSSRDYQMFDEVIESLKSINSPLAERVGFFLNKL